MSNPKELQLSKNLKRSEFTCSCGCGFDTVDTRLVTMLQSAVEYYKGVYPFADRVSIVITGGSRCPKHNEAIGGASGSLHLWGQAADHHIKVLEKGQMFRVDEGDLASYYRHALLENEGGIGLYDNGRVHLDVRTRGRAEWDARSTDE